MCTYLELPISPPFASILCKSDLLPANLSFNSLGMNVLLHHSRRLLQETAASSLPPASADDPNSNDNFDINAHFSPSMAIILVVLLSAFFFMGFFSIYVKRCSARGANEEARPRTADATQPPNLQTRGVDAAFLETLPLVTYSASKKKGSNVECVVCLTDFNEGEPLCQLPRCKHAFHKECIDMWLFSHTTCPLCRRSVMSDASRSFRWGGSGSLRLSLARRGSGRESGLGLTGGPSTPSEGNGGLTPMDQNASANADQIVMPRAYSLPRSHSTGHSFAKPAQGRMMMTREETCGYSSAEDMETRTGCLPRTPGGRIRRTRSMVAVRGDAPAMGSISTWMREAGATLKRAMSLKRVSPAAGDFATPVGLAASSSARSTFDRLDPV